MCFRYERESEPERRHAAPVVPPRVPQSWLRPVVGVAATAAVAVAAAFLLPDMLHAKSTAAAPQAETAAALADRTLRLDPPAPRPSRSSTRDEGAAAAAHSRLVMDDEVAPPAASESRSSGGCHHGF